jgi:hypothetical protein
MGYKKGDIVYYKIRFVFADGHITRTNLPQMLKAEGINDRFDTTINLVEDLDSTAMTKTYPIVEVYRKVNEGPFLLLERYKPSTKTMTRKTGIGQFTTPDGVQFTPPGGVPSSSFYDPDTDTLTIVDRGQEGSITPLADVNNVFTEAVSAQAVARDRVVLGGLTYPNVDVQSVASNGAAQYLYDAEDEGQDLTALTEDDSVLPPKTTLQLYGKAQFEDGTESVHFPVSDSITTTTLTSKVSFTQVSGADLNKDNIRELGLYLNYETNPDDSEDYIEFDSNEIANAKSQTLSSLYGNVPDNFPANPLLWVGYKYIMLEGGSISSEWIVTVEDGERNSQKDPNNDDRIVPENERGYYFTRTESIINEDLPTSTNFSDPTTMPDTITVQLIGNTELKYNLVGYDSSPDERKAYEDDEFPTQIDFRFIYKLDFVDALKTAAINGDLQIRAKTTQFNSNSVDQTRYTSEWVNVIGVQDSSISERLLYQDRFGLPKSNNVYLVLDSDSIYSEVDINPAVDTYSPYAFGLATSGVFTPTNTSIDLSAVGTFEIRGLKIIDDTPSTYNTANDIGIRSNWTYGYSLEQEDIEGLVYVGKLDWPGRSLAGEVFDTNSYLRHTGYSFTKENNYLRARLNPYNIYEKRILANNLRASQDVFPNQIVFSEPATNELYSGNRIFDYKSFIDIDPQYGKILGLHATESILMIFTERAIGFARVGEALTQSASGETFVNTDAFLSSPQWILTNIRKYFPRSVFSADSAVYFTDGIDLYAYSGGLQNLTNNTIDIQTATEVVVGYDPKNREIVLTLTYENYDKTFAFNLDLKQWYGPYTYKNASTFTYQGEYYAVVGTDLVKHNVGNNFAGIQYNTIIDSGANDLGDSSVVKTYRRLLLEYEKDDGSDDDINVVYSDRYVFPDYENIGGNNRTVNDMGDYNDGLKRLGIRTFSESLTDPDPLNNTFNSKNNSRNFFWRVITKMSGFALRMVGLEYYVRGRR